MIQRTGKDKKMDVKVVRKNEAALSLEGPEVCREYLLLLKSHSAHQRSSQGREVI